MEQIREPETTYIRLNQKRDIRFPFELHAAGVIWTSSSYDFRTPGYQYLEFCLRLGSREIEAVDELDEEIYHTGFPHLLIKRSGVSHNYKINGSRHAVFLIYPPELETEFEHIGISLNPSHIEFSITSELESLLNTFCELIQESQNYGNAEKLDILAFQIIETIYMQQRRTHETVNRTDIIIREIASYLQMNYTGVIDINAICRRFGISSRSFFRNWSKHYDQTPFKYILDLKIQEAERLLLSSDIQIKEVAAHLGFKNYSYFIQVFRRCHNDITPGDFRRSQRST